MSRAIKRCMFCGKEVKGWGNNPWPFLDCYSGDVCCDKCNDQYVIPARNGELPEGIIKTYDGKKFVVGRPI